MSMVNLTASQRGIVQHLALQVRDEIGYLGFSTTDLDRKSSAEQAEYAFKRLAETLGYRVEKIVDEKTETVAKFGHHPEAAIDFCVEVEAIEGEWFNVQMGFENGTPTKDELMARVDAAMSFRVGGDLNAIKAKALLREIDKSMKTGPSSAPRDTPSIRPGLSDAGVTV